MATKKLMLGLVGMPASGKSTIAAYLAKKHGAEVVYTAEYIWRYLESKGIKKTEESAGMAGLYLWANYQDIPITQWTLERIKHAKLNLIVLDSIRTMDEANAMASRFGTSFHVVAILASPAVRFERARNRARLGKVTWAEFKQRDQTELIAGQGDVLALAEHYIVGNTSIKGTWLQIETVLRQIRKLKKT